MSDTPASKNVTNDEIDLLDLFKRFGNALGRMFRTLGRWFMITIVFLLRNWLPLGLSLVLGVGVSYLLKYSSPSFYTSDLIFKTNTMTASDMISYINRLHTYCEEDNQAALMYATALKPYQTKNILDIHSNWIIDKGADGIPDQVDFRDSHNIYDTLNIRMWDRFNVRVKIRVPQQLDTISKGLIHFINSDSLFQQSNRVRLRQNEELYARLNYDIEQLDSLQEIKYYQETKMLQPQSGGQMIFLQEHVTQLVFPEIYDLFTKKQLLDQERTLYKEITTVLSEFSIPAKRDNGGLYYGKVVIPIIFVLALIILVIRANRKRLKEILRKY